MTGEDFLILPFSGAQKFSRAKHSPCGPRLPARPAPALSHPQRGFLFKKWITHLPPEGKRGLRAWAESLKSFRRKEIIKGEGESPPWPKGPRQRPGAATALPVTAETPGRPAPALPPARPGHGRCRESGRPRVGRVGKAPEQPRIPAGLGQEAGPRGAGTKGAHGPRGSQGNARTRGAPGKRGARTGGHTGEGESARTRGPRGRGDKWGHTDDRGAGTKGSNERGRRTDEGVPRGWRLRTHPEKTHFELPYRHHVLEAGSGRGSASSGAETAPRPRRARVPQSPPFPRGARGRNRRRCYFWAAGPAAAGHVGAGRLFLGLRV